MFPDYSSYAFRNQRGFLLPLALFILIVMGILAVTISRTSLQTQTSSTQEVFNIQAFYAAESGAQRGMQKLFLANASRQITDNTCSSLAINHSFPGVNGLRACTAVVICQCVYRNGAACAPSNNANYLPTSDLGVIMSSYTLTSTGSCGTDQYRAVRTILVGAFLEQ